MAILGGRGVFAEIGKREIWSASRHIAVTPFTVYCAVALDSTTAADSGWTRRAFARLSARAANGHGLTGLPLRSFEMIHQHELAFRTLQSGLNIGKIIVRLLPAPWTAKRVSGIENRMAHLITGGTAGLGLLTARWIAQLSEHSNLLLVSRSAISPEAPSGHVSHSNVDAATASEWKALRASSAAVRIEACDVSESSDVLRAAMISPAAMGSSVTGIWHAAGTLADRTLANQSCRSLAHVFAPKAHGAFHLHSALANGAPILVCAISSSVSAVLGSPGQSNYSAANFAIDCIAAFRVRSGVRGVSVQWGSWAEIGMAARGAAAIRSASAEASLGLMRISIAEG